MAFKLDHLINQVLQNEELQRSTTDIEKLNSLRKQKKKLISKMVNIKIREYEDSYSIKK